MPRRTKTVQRGVVLNKHKVRYWLSVGAQPTNGVAKMLNKYGSDFWPKLPVPLGSASLYERPEKQYKLEGYKDYFSEVRNPRFAYKQMLQDEMNIVERKRRIQAEAMANFGGSVDIGLIKTDDIESEEADIMDRVSKFKELKRRLDEHRKMSSNLRGNDLRYNVYIKKMQKLTRKDLGLDVEAYKDYCNNLKIFASYNNDYQILSENNQDSVQGTLNSILNTDNNPANKFVLDDELLDKMRTLHNEKEKLGKMKNTVGKLFREYHSPISE